ncbi:hypothetical protein GCM10023321_68000 [Pseudonocardia eucalypti]|uniref:SGNH hydrolase-type esterase domain-containing protein n=1 Tax=Pseudonocardia eucalypti TaxID=648755 RepID=A0ABP9R1U3_9PSEU
MIVRQWDGWLSRVSALAVTAITVASSGLTDAEPSEPATPSHYVVSVGTDQQPEEQGYQSGCADGRIGRSGLHLLFFGTQQQDGQLRPPGTTNASPAVRISEDWVAKSAGGWIRGYAECGSSRAVLALGVNNKTDGGADPANAGASWARLVERVGANAPADRVTVTGALDGEPGWSKPDWARGWVDAYVAGTGRMLYAANSADGCAADGGKETCGNGWTMADVHYVSTGAKSTVVAVPQIYRTDGIQARQWAAISRWGAKNGAGPLRLVGVLTQETACQQRGPCPRTGNSPNQALKQLADALNADSSTRLTTALISTDVAWPPNMPAP